MKEKLQMYLCLSLFFVLDLFLRLQHKWYEFTTPYRRWRKLDVKCEGCKRWLRAGALRNIGLCYDCYYEWGIHPACHASCAEGFKCADCTMDKEPCPFCYRVWWHCQHPSTRQY